MHKARIIGLAVVVICAALAAYFWWPSDATKQPVPAPPALQRPVLPVEPIRLPLQPSPEAGPVSTQEDEASPGEGEVPSAPEPPSEEPITSVGGLTLSFFDDLAQRIVDRYSPARSEHNAGDNGVLLLSLSALNRRYGVEMTGLEYAATSELEAREEIFNVLLRPDVIDASWKAFGTYFVRTLIDQSLGARRSFVHPAGGHNERALNVEEIAEFFGLLSAFTRNAAQAVRVYARSDQAVPRTNAWLEAQSEAMAANARYQYAEALLEETLREAPAGQEQAAVLRLERDAAASEILQTISLREQAKGHLLALHKDDAMARELHESDLLFIDLWLYRRLHGNPDRALAFLTIAQRLSELAVRLQEAAAAITSPPPGPEQSPAD